MKIEFGKKSAGAFGFLVGYAMIQGVFYGTWSFNDFPTNYSFGVWTPTILAGVVVCIASIVIACND
jgi:hypothetical protein